MTKEDILREEYEKLFASPKYKDSVNKKMNQLYIFPAMDQYYNQAIDDAIEKIHDVDLFYDDGPIEHKDKIIAHIKSLKKKS